MSNPTVEQGIRCYRIMHQGLPVAEYTGLSDEVSKKLARYVAAFEEIEPAVIEEKINGMWEPKAYITGQVRHSDNPSDGDETS